MAVGAYAMDQLLKPNLALPDRVGSSVDADPWLSAAAELAGGEAAGDEHAETTAAAMSPAPRRRMSKECIALLLIVNDRDRLDLDEKLLVHETGNLDHR